MAAFTGRGVVLELNGANVMCFRTVSLSMGDASIDVSDSCSNGFRELAEDGDQRQIDLTVDGVAKTTWLRALMLGSSTRILNNVTIRWPAHAGGEDGAVLTGSFRLSGYTEDFTYNDVTTFSVTLESTGAWTFTDESGTPPTPTPTPTPAPDWRPLGADEVSSWLPLSITATDTYQGDSYPFTLPATTNTEPASAMVALFEPVGEWNLDYRRPTSITVHLTAPMQVDIVSVEAFSMAGSLGNESSWNGVWGEGDHMSITIPIRPYDWDEERVEGLVLVATYLGNPETVNGHWPQVRGISLDYTPPG